MFFSKAMNELDVYRKRDVSYGYTEEVLKNDIDRLTKAIEDKSLSKEEVARMRGQLEAEESVLVHLTWTRNFWKIE